MKQSAEIAQLLLNLTTVALFGGDSAALDQIERELSSQDFQGLAVRGVAEVSVTERDSLPVVLASQFTALRDWETPLSDNLSILVFDHVTAAVSVAKPFEDSLENRPDPGRPPSIRPKPSGDAATGVATSCRRVDLRKLLSLEWSPRRLTVVAVSYDIVSNEYNVVLAGGKSDAPIRSQVTPAPGARSGGISPCDPAVVSPNPSRSSVKFSVEVRPVPLSCVVKGELSTVAIACHLHPGVAEAKRCAVVVSVTCIVVGRDWRNPWTFEWQIPVDSDSDGAPGAPLSAFFSVPLPEDRLALLSSGEYIAYIMLEGHVFGPQRFTIPAAPYAEVRARPDPFFSNQKLPDSPVAPSDQWRGVLINVPERAAINIGKPVVRLSGLARISGADYPKDDRLELIAIDLATRKEYTAFLDQVEENLVVPPPAKPPTPDVINRMIFTRHFNSDIRAALSLPIANATYRLTLQIGDLRSNDLTVQIVIE
jgi:hypothetical protein